MQHWTPPKTLPNLSAARGLVVDLEFRDNALNRDMGLGWPWRDGYVTGIGVAPLEPHAPAFYIPIAHEGGDNFRDPEQAVRWAQDTVRKSRPKFCHQAMAELGWGSTIGLDFGADVHDTYAMAKLLDENQLSYTLDACAAREGIPGKDDQLLWEGFAAIGGKIKKNTATKRVKEQLWRMPARYVGPYGEQDLRVCRELAGRYSPRIEAEGLTDVYNLERELLPLLIDMRARGIRIDVNEAERLWDYTHALEVEARNRIKWRFGINLGRPKSAAELAAACDTLGLPYLMTAGTAKRKPQPSFTKKWMEAQTHPFFAEINYLRHVQTIRSLCIESCMLSHIQRGRVHPELNPLRTVSGRFSCSNPNDQQVSARTELGRMVRGCFLPEEGEEWLSGDVKQQEPRIMVSYACKLKLPRAAEAAKMFTGDTLAPCRCGAVDKAGNPKPFGKCCGDWHTIAARMVDGDREETKPISLGVPYGMKAGKLSRDARIPFALAQEKLDQYHARMPFIGGLMDACARRVQERGYVTTVLGRRRRFDLWEPIDFKGERPAPLPKDLAVKKWGDWNIKRAKDYIGMNGVVQGSGADQIKVAMRDCWRDGLGKHLLLQVHDELCASTPNREIAREICERVENAIRFHVPIVCEPKVGRNWKEAKVS